MADAVTTASSEKRVQWGHGAEFVMSCIAMCVGLGNVWRFPFTAYENGGGAFIIPYIFVLLAVGQPLYYMEMILGQFSSQGMAKMYGSLKPALIGVGYGQLIGTSCVASYYCALMAITMFYFGNSFTWNMPWATCNPNWKIEKNLSCVASAKHGSKDMDGISSSELWYTKEVLKQLPNIDDGIGWPEWRLTLCLFISWIITAAVSIRGVRSSGKAAYFLVVFPYAILLALLVRACTLEGSVTGIIFFYKPDWSKLADAQVWYAAVTQCFFSLNVGFGTIIMYSSYNSFTHNIQRDVLIITSIDTMTSLMAGTTIFGILGNLAHELKVNVDEVVHSGGTGLAFISYPEAIAKFEHVPWLFALLFFLMLFVLGVGSLVAFQGCANTTILDAFPKMKDWQASVLTAFIGFIIGLMYMTPGGQFVLTTVDHFGGTVIIIILVIIEITSVSWWYGLKNFCIDVEFMRHHKVSPYWRFMWSCVTPVLLIVIFIYFCVKLERLKYGDADIAIWALACGWLILFVTVFQLIAWFIYYLIINRDLGVKGTFAKTFSSENWIPLDPDTAAEFKKVKEEKLKEIADQEHSCMGGICSTLIGKT